MIYIKNGIFFYVLCIVVWQVYAALSSGVTSFMIYGMVSCTLTFLVVEFLAAWFLRQYRSYVDASAHLVRVRSIFQRYLLSYLGMKEFAERDGSGLAKMRAEVLKVLSQEIKWPDPARGAKADFNHMNEMFDAVSQILVKAKDVIKPTSRVGEDARREEE